MATIGNPQCSWVGLKYKGWSYLIATRNVQRYSTMLHTWTSSEYLYKDLMEMQWWHFFTGHYCCKSFHQSNSFWVLAIKIKGDAFIFIYIISHYLKYTYISKATLCLYISINKMYHKQIRCALTHLPGRCGSNFKCADFKTQHGYWYIENSRKHYPIMNATRHCLEYLFSAVMLQVIAWASVDQDPRRHMASLCHNELKKCSMKHDLSKNYAYGLRGHAMTTNIMKKCLEAYYQKHVWHIHVSYMSKWVVAKGI